MTLPGLGPGQPREVAPEARQQFLPEVGASVGALAASCSWVSAD